jgi:hypothetical protein
LFKRTPPALAGLALLALPLVLVACGGGSGSGSSANGTGGGGATTAAAAPQALCQELNAVLSDGPDPHADPVGYALSQILPLEQQVHSSDTAVMAEVAQLIAADKAFYNSNGADKSAASTIAKNYTAINKACPGVAP